jgi:hypothetical protein
MTASASMKEHATESTTSDAGGFRADRRIES